MINLKNLIFVICIGIFSFVLTGCENTISGFGKDLQSAGQDIEKSTNN